MRLRAPSAAPFVLALLPSISLALGLGDIQLKSGLNAPLNAEIEVLGATPEELTQLRVQMASRELFSRYGLDYPGFLSGINVALGRSADGRDVIQLTSVSPMTEPFATLLIEANLTRERMVREYTVLFDPPVFAPGAAAPAPLAAPVVGAGERSGSVGRTAPVAPPPVAPPPVAAAGGAEGTYVVRPGDTLSRVSREQVAGDPSQTDRVMIAIFRANPSAFDGNINILKSGAVLRLPDAAAVAAVDPGEAVQEVRRQSAAWTGARGEATTAAADPRLRLIVPSGQSATDTGTGESQALRDRVSQLETELAESRRLLELRNAELARLQAGDVAVPAPEAQPVPAPVAEAPVEAAPATDLTVAEAPAPEPQPEAAPAATPEPVAEAPQPVAPPEPGLFDLLSKFWYIPVGLLALVLGLMGIRALRRRSAAPSFDSGLGTMVADSLPLGRESSSNTFPLRKAPEFKEQAFVVEEATGTQERVSFTGQTRKVEVEDASPTASLPAADATAALEQGDPLAEADFHMAYGLYDQAADLVRLAIDREPKRRDLKLKLLEVFFVWGNKDQFLQTSRELASSRGMAEPGEWEKIVIMGKQLAPEDALFAQAASGLGTAGVDLNLEGGQNRVDFDLHGEPTVLAVAPEAPVDLDLGSALVEALGDRDPTGNTSLDFTLDDPARGDDPARTATTRQMVQPGLGGDGGTLRFDGSEGPTVEQPAFEPGQTLRQKLDAQLQFGAPASDQTAELALDDLGLDLGKLENTGAGLNALDDSRLTQVLEGTDAPTLVAGLGDTSRQMLSPGLEGHQLTELLPVGEDFPNTGATSQMRRIDFEVGATDLSATAETGTQSLLPATGVDLDVGSPDSGATGRFVATQRLEPDFLSPDATTRDLEPITMSEVGTKLDLARAYMDMGDPDGARNILNEVLQEGSPVQKQEAQRLIDSIPG
jgi:pilus assembly protein FimV